MLVENHLIILSLRGDIIISLKLQITRLASVDSFGNQCIVHIPPNVIIIINTLIISVKVRG